MAWDQHLIAEPEGPSFISRTVTHRRLDRRYSCHTAKAETFRDPEAQRMMLEIAVTYVEVARRLEREAGDSPGRPI